MAGRPCTFLKEDLTRALLAAKKAGVDIQRFEIENGKITVVTGKPVSAELQTELDTWVKNHEN